MYSVLIADDNRNWIEILSTKINQEKEFKVTAVAYDGKEAIEQINTHKPDIVIIDLIMPEFDGIYIVSHIRKNMAGYNPFIYILTGIGTDSMIKKLHDYDVSYYSMKPVTLDVIIQRLREMTTRTNPAAGSYNPGEVPSEYTSAAAPKQKRSVEDIIKETIYQLGILPHLKSNKYAREAVLFYINNPDSPRMLTKLLYPEIAKQHNSTPSAIERNVRDAIFQMQKNQTELSRQIFAEYSDDKITNGEFLSIIANYINKITSDEESAE